MTIVNSINDTGRARARPVNDPVESAARSLRGIERDKARFRRSRTAIVVSAVVLVALAVGAIVTGFVCDAEAGVWTLTVAVLAVAGLNYAVTWYGAAVMVASMTAAAAVTLLVGARFDLGWGQLAAVAAIAASTWVIGTSRRLRFPRTPAAITAQWCVPAALAAAGAAGAGVAVTVAVAVAVIASAAAVNIGAWLTARRASRRSGIPMNPGSNLARTLIGLVPPPDMVSANLQAGISAEQKTAAELSTLGPEWTVLHSRSLPGTNADVDHVVIGPAGVLLIDTKHRSGTLTYLGADSAASPERLRVLELFGATDAAGSGWELNGRDAAPLAASSMFEAACIDDLLAMPQDRLVTPVVLAVHGAVMDTDSGIMQVATEAGYTADVHVVAGPHIAGYLQTLPTLGKSEAFLADLAVVVDYLLPPKM
ncbi:nuclease-related domain-containing protein [Prescottella subtropica]|uniref:nuclease-related domain-containing protein n=1 Tax=Prescottella subtropica TaxID=2545757 RepID=UPI0013871FED|nr:nuclease-related domain-containing protein [Prescottella subtropica]